MRTESTHREGATAAALQPIIWRVMRTPQSESQHSVLSQLPTISSETPVEDLASPTPLGSIAKMEAKGTTN